MCSLQGMHIWIFLCRLRIGQRNHANASISGSEKEFTQVEWGAISLKTINHPKVHFLVVDFLAPSVTTFSYRNNTPYKISAQ